MPNGICVNIPTLRAHDSPRCAVTIGAEGVEIKGKSLFICTKVYVGFLEVVLHLVVGLCEWRFCRLVFLVILVRLDLLFSLELLVL